MSWLPPRSYADRMRWAKQHTWIAACYFATVMSVFSFFLPLLMKTSADLRFRTVLSLAMWPVSVLLLVLSVKRRWGLRPDTDDQPAPSPLRPWRWASDRSLLAFLVLGIAAVPFALLQFAQGSSTVVGAVVGFLCALFIAVTTWRERRHRRTQPE